MTVREGSREMPDLERYSDTPMFNTKAVVQQTGVPAPTLRAWERRYTLLSPERAGNTYRLYSERDIVMIRWLKEQVDSGMSISQAIALFRHKNSELHLPEEQETSSQSISPNSSTVDDLPAFQIAIEQEQSKVTQQKNENDQLNLYGWPKLGIDDTQSIYTTTYNICLVRKRLLEAFYLFDEAMANMLMGLMLAIYPVEQICTELIAPTMWQFGQLWIEDQFNISVEHFASNFFRALLTNLFHVTPSPSTGPTAIVCCAPGEPHELAPLMLALFLRRSGVRVVYLGQSIETTSLLQTIKKLTPSLVCVSLTMPAYLSDVIDLARQLEEMAPPHPIFAFGGQVFAQYANMIPQIPGIYLTGDLKTVVARLRNMAVERLENKN